MKKVIFYILAIAITNSLFAQTTAVSQTINLVNCSSNSELVCSDNNKHTVVYNMAYANPNKHQFIVQDMDLGTKKEFGLTNIQNYDYNILDIELKNGICYFCGTYEHILNNIVYHPGIGWGNEHEDKGFIGYFNINDVLSGAGAYYIIEIDETEEISHLAIVDNNFVYAVGYPQGSPLDINNMRCTTCFVALDKDQSNSNRWSYDILTPRDGEILMDIATNPDGVFTVSRFQNDNYSFGVRYVKPISIQDPSYRQQINRLYKFDTEGMGTLEFQEKITWREEYSPILIDGHTVTHVCGDAYHNYKGLMIYKLNTSTMFSSETLTLSQAQYVSTNNHTKLLDMKEYSYTDPSHQSLEYVSMLVLDPTLHRSTIKRAIWGKSANYLQTNLFCDNSNIILNDIAPYKLGQYLLSVGHNAGSHLTLENSQHTCHIHELGKCCLDNNTSNLNYPILSCINETSGDTLTAYGPIRTITAATSNFTSTTVGTTNSCSY